MPDEKTAKNSGCWQKGKSGNPSGRPKMSDSVRDLIRKSGEMALRRLVELAQCEDRVVAQRSCVYLCDRAYGKPLQQTELSGADGEAFKISVSIVEYKKEKE